MKKILPTPAKKLAEEIQNYKINQIIIFEPKRIKNFVVKFSEELPIASFFVISINKPKWENGKWSNIEIILRDVIHPSTTYYINDFINSYEEKDAKSPIFDIRIISLDPTLYPIEEWYIGVEKIVSVDYSHERLDYNVDDELNIQTIKLVLKPSKCILLY